MPHRDLIVIGGGPAGAAALGHHARVRPRRGAGARQQSAPHRGGARLARPAGLRSFAGLAF